MEYRMRSLVDCGPAALSGVTGIPYERILSEWPGGWMNGDRGILGVPNDTPWDHFALLECLGIKWRVISLADILAGRFAGDKTLVLLHRPGSFVQATLAQHWGVIQSVQRGAIRVHMGNGNIRTFTREEMTQAYADGWPACAYVVGEGRERLSWWSWLVATLTGRFV